MTADKTAVPEWIDVAFADGFGWSTYAAHEGDKTRFIRADLCPSGQVKAMNVDDLAQIIRVVDGNNTLGAGELAEAILEAMPAPRIVGALTPAPEVIAKGLSDDTTGLGRFGHHPDPAIDFCIEVEMLDSRLHQAEHGLCKPGDTPETVAEVLADIKRAMEFTVGGDEGAVRAKSILRSLEKRATPTAQEAVPVAWGESYDGGAFFNTVSLTKTKHHTYPLYAHPPQPSVSVAEAGIPVGPCRMCGEGVHDEGVILTAETLIDPENAEAYHVIGYTVRCCACGASVSDEYLDDAVSLWNGERAALRALKGDA